MHTLRHVKLSFTPCSLLVQSPLERLVSKAHKDQVARKEIGTETRYNRYADVSFRKGAVHAASVASLRISEKGLAADATIGQ